MTAIPHDFDGSRSFRNRAFCKGLIIRSHRLLKAATPGSYTFILEGTKELPRRLMHPKRKTIGVRAGSPVCLWLV